MVVPLLAVAPKVIGPLPLSAADAMIVSLLSEEAPAMPAGMSQSEPKGKRTNGNGMVKDVRQYRQARHRAEDPSVDLFTALSSY